MDHIPGRRAVLLLGLGAAAGTLTACGQLIRGPALVIAPDTAPPPAPDGQPVDHVHAIPPTLENAQAAIAVLARSENLTVAAQPQNGAVVVRFRSQQDLDRFAAALARPRTSLSLHLVMDFDGPAAMRLYDDGVQTLVGRRPLLRGNAIQNAVQSYDSNGNPAVAIRLTPEGARTFAQITSANVGRRMAIVLDGRIISAPVILNPITGGSLQITGGFTREDARALARRIELARANVGLKIAGRLPPL